MEVWTGAISGIEGYASDTLKEICLYNESQTFPLPPLPQTSLEFLALVDPGLVPLHIIAGSPLKIARLHDDTKAWFREQLLDKSPLVRMGEGAAESIVWHQAGLPQSNIGVLVKVNQDIGLYECANKQNRITEILFYASQESDKNYLAQSPPTSPLGSTVKETTYLDEEKQLILEALPLCSGRFYADNFHSPPTPPPDGKAYFLSPSVAPVTDHAPASIHNDVDTNITVLADTSNDQLETIEPSLLKVETQEHESATASAKKRGHLTDLFDAADERRKKTRHKGGISVSLAASHSQAISWPGLADRAESSFDQGFDPVRIKVEDEENAGYNEDVKVLTVKRKSNTSTVKDESPLNTPSASLAKSRKRATLSTLPTSQAQAHSNPMFAQKAAPSTSSFSDMSLDSRNKQIVSRTVMACMRLHGLEQRCKPQTRSQKSQPETLGPSKHGAQIFSQVTNTGKDSNNKEDYNTEEDPLKNSGEKSDGVQHVSTPLERKQANAAKSKETEVDTETAKARDYDKGKVKENDKAKEENEAENEEYKQIYHQTYKGTLFAFRNVSSSRLLQADEARKVAHQLLEIFCALPRNEDLPDYAA